MRSRFFFFSFLIFFAACEKYEPEGYHALSEEQRKVLPLMWQQGDTVTFLYSNSNGKDTQYYIVQPDQNYLNSAWGTRQTMVNETFEVLKRELVELDGNTRMELALGYEDYGSPFGGQYFNITYQGIHYITMLSNMKNSLDTLVYKLRIDHWDLSKRDSVEIHYSAYSGLVSLRDSLSGFELKRLP